MATDNMRDKRVVIVGGGSGMGFALAELLVAEGARVHLAGRSEQKLAAARQRLGPAVTTSRVDIADEDAVKALLAEPVEHIVVTAADVNGAYGPIGSFPVKAAWDVLGTKVIGPWLVAKHAAAVMATGSITFTSGINAYRPGPGSSALSTANGALEALARTLAVELAPVRVNVVSPGWVDTPIWDDVAGPAKVERFAAMAAKLPAGRIGRPEDIAQAFRAIMANEFITGTTLHVEGGHRLV